MRLKKEVSDKDHFQGNNTAPLTLVEYGDYECPYCQKAYYIIKEAQKQFGDNLKFVFRNFPLTEIHPYAFHAAIATEVAGAQGKFWEMHDILFENQQNLEDNYLLEYADELDLDIKKFETDLSNKKFVQKIEKDYVSGIESGVEGTPTLFINGKKFNGNWMGEEFIEAMRSLI